MGSTHATGTQTKGNVTGSRETRAVALVGPAGTGKTSLAEALLFACGAITRQGTVEAGTTVGDASPEARARGGSTEINLAHFDFLGDRYALVDVPGGAGFAADGLAALQSADLAVVVIDPAPERAALAERSRATRERRLRFDGRRQDRDQSQLQQVLPGADRGLCR